jgi:signal transduction histidine kinase
VTSVVARRPQVVPVAFAAGTTAVAVAAVVVMAAAGGDVVESHMVVDVLVGAVSASLGGLLVARLPRNPMGWLFALSGVAYVGTAAVSAWAVAARAWQWPGLLAAAWTSEWLYLLALGPQLTLLLLLFPDGAPPSPRWRPLTWLSTGLIFALVVAWALVPRIQVAPGERVPNPLGGSAFAESLAGPLLVVLGVCVLVCFASLVVRLVRAGPDDRGRIAPYVTAAALAIVAMGATPPLAAVGPYVQTVVLPLLPIAATLCVLRYRLYDLEVVVRRSLVWLGLTVLVIGGYALVVTAVSNLLRREAGLAESLLAAGVVAAVFQPARLWLQQAVGRALYGSRDDPGRALADLGRTLEVTAEPTAALDGAAERIAAALAVPWVAIEVSGEDEQPVHTAVSGRRPGWADPGAVTTVPLVHAGAPHGSLSVARRSPHEPLAHRDVDLLERLAHPIAAAAAAFRLTHDLRRSRERLVVAREEERRRLRADLHDDLGPQLAAVAIQLDAATLRARRTGADDGPLVDLRAATDDAIATLRRAVEDLRPPALDELGLPGAVRAAVARLETVDGPRVAVVGPEELLGLSAAAEVAAYRIAVEGVLNAVRHAAARSVTCRMTVEGPALVVEVCDDGRGAGGRSPGVGLGSMRDRAEELGGAFSVSGGAERGTRIRAELPVGGDG